MAYHTPEQNSLSIIEEVGRIISKSISPEATLQAVVAMVASELGMDACSIYLLERDQDCLTLVATVGLNPESVGKICMRPDEGLTGLALQSMSSVLVRNPERHPRYRYFAGSGEERFHNFLGIPLVYHGETLGVLVVQTVEEDGIDDTSALVFSMIASQIAGAAAYAALLRDLQLSEKEAEVLKEKLLRSEKKPADHRGRKGPSRGVPASAGFGDGYAFFYREGISFADIQPREIDNIEQEIRRFETALKKSETQIFSVCNDVQSNLSADNAAIFQAYLMYLRDGGLKHRVVEVIRKGQGAEYALKEVILNYTKIFSRIEDPYLQERGHDIEHIGIRVLRNLVGVEEEKTLFQKKTILIATNISPAELLHLRQENLKGIILSRGGETSHVTILARSLEIPMVIGVEGLLGEVREDDPLIVDGTSGFVFPNPSPMVIREYRRLEEEKAKQNAQLDSLKALKAQTTDGFEVRLGANIGLLSDLDLVERYGADHIGLYRTEFPFLSRTNFPTEDEQVNLYRRILKGAQGREVTIRTLDVGGDKFLSYLDYPKEDNPYLGWRSIRVSLELQDIFRAQIRAILRTSAFGPLKILFPMITSVREIRDVKAIMDEERAVLLKKGISFDPLMETGILVEVPGAVEILDKLLNYVDFISIGTNDLIQYVLAVDRNNQKVAEIYNPLDPAVISIIHRAAKIARDKGKAVALCGESASHPKCAYLYVGMGLDRLSMNAASVPVIKHMIRRTSLVEAKRALRRVLRMEDASEIDHYLDKVIPDRMEEKAYAS